MKARKARRNRTLEPARAYHVYVVETLTVEREALLYVGQSGKTPEARLEDHRAGCKRYCSSCACRHYVGGRRMRLRYDLFAHVRPVRTRREAEVLEKRLARSLRRRGYHVIGGH
jgi:hypothetical protein